MENTHVPSRQSYQILHFAFTVAPILAGVDKFFHLLCNWDQYLAPWLSNIFSGLGTHNLMMIVGVIEIIAGITVAVKPRVGSWIVSAWLVAIIINLLTTPGYYDIALRDFGLLLGALALARASAEFDHALAVPQAAPPAAVQHGA